MSIELKVNYYPSVRHQDSAMVKTLASIVDEIQSDQHGDLVKAIRATEDKDKIKSLKAQLPIFLAALVDGKPTGIVSFDIDKKDNVGVESARLKGSLEQIPSCVYAFESPSGGIKFGILTDFHDDGIDKPRMSRRYRIAYDRTLEYVKQSAEMEFVDDRANRSIYQKCYFSNDRNADFNPDCETLKVDHDCIVEAPVQQAVNLDYSDEFVLELLTFIPKDLSYSERLPINYAVLEQLGELGVASLAAHWDKEDKPELERKLRDQLKNLQFGSIGHLIKVAKENGYTEATGRARNHLRPQSIQLQAYPLVSVEEGIASLSKTVRSFFQGNRNVFLNVSTGAGKSYAVLNVLVKEIPLNKKVLVLVPTHALGKELMNTFTRLRTDHIDATVNGNTADNTDGDTKSAYPALMRLKANNRVSNLVHLRGQQKGKTEEDGEDGLCQMKENRFHKEGRNVPWQECSRCPMSQGCKYLDQFNGLFDNIRIMTHNEWINRESVWFSGYHSLENGDLQPRQSGGWKPDYIVIDENIFNVNLNEITSDRGDKFPSIKQIVDDVARGVPLADAIVCNSNELLEDAKLNIRPDYPRSNLSESAYEIVRNEYGRKMKEFSTVLEKLVLYANTGERRYLLGVWVEDGSIHHAPTTYPEDRYANIPTLFLDATANEAVVRRFVPDIEFHRIAIRSNPEVKLYQLADTTVSRHKLAKSEFREYMIDWLKKIIAKHGYSNVGLITYKKVQGVDGGFDEYLAKEIGASVFNHFGAIRGVNSFETTDCLLIVGRHFIGTDRVTDMASAIFGETSDYDDAYVDKPVRMIGGSIMAINCKAAINDKHNAINQHYCLSETIQAVGRARSIHGSNKDIYYFSNESLGLDVEVSDFFYQDASASHVVPTEAVNAIIETGYVQDKPSELIKIGVNGNIIKNHRDELTSELDGLGIPRLTCRMRDSKNRPRRVSYFVNDIDLFKTGCKIDNKTFEAFETQQ